MTSRRVDRFDEAVRSAEQKCAELLASRSYQQNKMPQAMPSRGVYLFSEKGHMLYVGRSNNLRKRLQLHTRNSHNQATFAFLIARDKTGIKKASYQRKRGRAYLLEHNQSFRDAFDDARKWIPYMDVRFVEERDGARQALLEICVALRTKAKYNRFDPT